MRANNPTFKKAVLDAVKYIEDFLWSSGWRTKVGMFCNMFFGVPACLTRQGKMLAMQVEQHEKYWGFDAVPGSSSWL